MANESMMIRIWRRGGSRPAPTDVPMPAPSDGPTFAPTIKPLGQLIGAFKTVSAKQINLARHTPGAPVWQRNYYEHIIRDGNELDAIRRYILNNPIQWELNQENPLRIEAAAEDYTPTTSAFETRFSSLPYIT